MKANASSGPTERRTTETVTILAFGQGFIRRLGQAARHSSAPSRAGAAMRLSIVHCRARFLSRTRGVCSAALFAVASCRSAPTFPSPTQVPVGAQAPSPRLPALDAVWGFTAPWDARSDTSVRSNASKLDVVVTGWIQLDSVTGQPSLRYPDDASTTNSGQRFA